MDQTFAQAAPLTAPATLTDEEQELAQLPLMMRLTALCLVATLAGWALQGQPALQPLAWLLFAVAYVSGGYFSVQNAWATIRAHSFDINMLMLLAALGALALGEPLEGALLMFLFSLAGTLETYAMGRTHAAVSSLLDLAPQEAEVYRDGGLQTVRADTLAVGDLLLVRPGARIPADGAVERGESAVNEAPITGESMPAEKRGGSRVFSGTLNGQGALDVRVTAAAANSTLARIVAVVAEAREQKAASQHFTDKVIGEYYAYAVVAMTALAILVPPLLLGWTWGAAFYRAMTLMVVASPCALVISIPAALLAALAGAARGGVLFKGGAHLEAAARVRVVAFDKTGTLTTGRPGVVAIVPVGGPGRLPNSLPCAACYPAPADDQLGELTPDQARIFAVAAAIERASEHPLARAIVAGADERGIPLPLAESFQSQTGAGASATVMGRTMRIGRPRLFALTPDVAIEVEAQERQGRTVVALGDEREVWGLIAVADTARPEAALAVAALRRAGIERVVLLTGDNRLAAEAIGREMGVDEVRAELLPEDKVGAVRDLQARYGPVAMVGDGINDAPALATATLGVAMGVAGSDVAVQSADMLLMADDLGRLPAALTLARRARSVVRQNLGFAFTVIALLLIFTLLGEVPLTLGVIGHEGSTLLVVINGLRLLRRI